MANTRKRTGAHRRKQLQKYGSAKPPDESKVRSAQQAAEFWEQLGRAELSTGLSLRVTPPDDLAAMPMILDACAKYARELAERNLPAVLVAGIQPVAKELDDIVSMVHAPEQQAADAQPEELVVAEG